MASAFDVLIVGAGIAGCACARELAEAGVQVGILERHTPGSGATAAGMGHIVVMDDSPAQLALTRYARSLWRQQSSMLPAAVEYEERGTLWLAADDDDMTEARAKQVLLSQGGVASDLLDSQSLRDTEPALRKDLAGALLVPEDAVLYPPVATSALLAAAERAGAKLLHGDVFAASAGVVRLRDGSTLASDHIIVATGAESHLFRWISLRKRKGHLAITDRYPGLVRHQLVELGYLKSAHHTVADSVACNIQPRRTGQLLIGSSRQYDQEDSAVDAVLLGAMLQRACDYVPRLASLAVTRVWTGLRAATADNLPLIGPTHDPTLYLLVGFEGLGITTAPAAARLLADHLLSRVPEIDIAPYLPERMAREALLHA